MYPPVSFPVGYLHGFLEWLATNDLRFLTYSDLAFQPKPGEEADEMKQWSADSSNHKLGSILLQYDIDDGAKAAMRLIRRHIELSMPANLMVFHRKSLSDDIGSGLWQEDTEYELDFELLREFEKIGSVVGYHCNAFERANGDIELALQYFEEDIDALRENLNIRHFSMHGGYVDASGARNGTLPVEDLANKLSVVWVHNGVSVHFTRTWSDGGADGLKFANECNDPLNFVLTTRPGDRTRLLLHPQYYQGENSKGVNVAAIENMNWVQQSNKFCASGHSDWRAFWADRAAIAAASVERFARYFEKRKEKCLLVRAMERFARCYENPRQSLLLRKIRKTLYRYEEPVFINGVSRSGTTLLVSMFDAHPDGAMAYESYPYYLLSEGGERVLGSEDYLFAVQCLTNLPEQQAFNLMSNNGLSRLVTFAAVTSWTGMSIAEVGELLRAYLATQIPVVPTTDAALDIVAASGRYKVEQSGGSFWGSKCDGDFAVYFQKWPEGSVVYIMRDGLDVLASQKTNGTFNPIAKDLGSAWSQNYRNFHAYMTAHPEHKCFVVKYEALVTEPEHTMRELCRGIGLSFHPKMVRQHKQRSTLAENPRGQLSVDRVRKPIDATAMGRWRDILSEDEVSEFLEGCGGLETYQNRGYSL